MRPRGTSISHRAGEATQAGEAACLIRRRTADRSGLRQYVDAMVNRGWSESDVRQSLRKSPEFRQRSYGGRYGNGSGYRGDQASEVVRRAYLGVLGREPDPAGMHEYRMRVLRDGWSERDVRRALRSSREYARRY